MFYSIANDGILILTLFITRQTHNLLFLRIILLNLFFNWSRGTKPVHIDVIILLCHIIIIFTDS